MTQFVRGEFFYYVDCLLTMVSCINTDDLPAVLDFMGLAFKLIIRWYELAPKLVPAFREANQAPQLFNVDFQAALAMCCFDLSQTIGRVFGVCKRAKQLFIKYKSEYLIQDKFCKQDKIAENGLNMSLVNLFGKLGGFKAVVDLA